MAALILSIPLACLAREEILAINGSEQFNQIPMNSGDYFEVDFTPTFDEINKLQLGLESEGLQGYCTISLWDKDKLEYQETVSLDNFNGNFQNISGNWELRRGKTYRLILEVDDIVQPMYIWVTADGVMPLNEYGELSINGHAVEGQLLTGVTYWTLPTSRKTQFFLVMTWFGVLVAAGYALWPKNIRFDTRK